LLRSPSFSQTGYSARSAALPRSTRPAPSKSSTPWCEGSMVISVLLFALVVGTVSLGKQVGSICISKVYCVSVSGYLVYLCQPPLAIFIMGILSRTMGAGNQWRGNTPLELSAPAL
jgi:hypothetical protein